MKKTDFKQEEIPALVGRNGAEVKPVDRAELKQTGVPFSGAGMAKGDTVEMPDSWDDVDVRKVQVRQNSDSWDFRILVKKNGRPAWLSLGYLSKVDKDRKPIHPVAEALTALHDNEEKIEHMLGKTIIAGEPVSFEVARFNADGQVIADVFDTKTAPKLEFKA